ncbi:uncharacterized protein LOC131444881 isoform X1 [Solea solea]|uniref:uncharacterized protein LOC131444881 isoform X1 n=1 Tax=Solea solea TaxID=90069 RepID=UPI00272C576E|nr:uncharacterized protein LOC131444881 isoform X1 [Solea solea]XP_058471563.1 uncharacterized protein LOC131444881 isoform X1 [Solea solea]XP_058471565.1 uncharacterized protein LOC131444881 isoform X1 [Solea solea]
MGLFQSVFDKSLNPGDLIEVDRGNYNDWAVYIGGNEVVHFVTNDSGSDRTSSNAEVKCEKLSDVLKGNSYKVNNLLDDKYEPRDPDDIVKDARSRIGRKYRVVNYNCKDFATELRYGKPESREPKKNPGDLIEVNRGNYSHWAVYIGGKEVVHLVRNDSASTTSFSPSGQTSSKSEVRCDKLSDVLNGDSYQVNNLLDDKYKPRNPDDIVKVAKKRIGPSKYDVVISNCEHFATEMRYGTPVSRQVKKWGGAVLVGVATGGGAAAATFAAGAAVAVVSVVGVLSGGVGVVVGLTVVGLSQERKKK